MTIYAADFGPDAAGQDAGVTEYSAAGAVVVARTTAGVVHMGDGFFVRDFTPNASTAVLSWDTGGVYAREEINAAAGGGGLTPTQDARLATLEKLLRNKMITDPSTGVLTVFDDDGATPLLTANIFKDAAGTTPYDGTGAERRERLA